MKNIFVDVIAHTNDPEEVCEAAGRNTYKPELPSQLFVNAKQDQNKTVLKNIVRMGHHSVIEHANFTIVFEGVSVFFEQFLIEFRLASYTAKSRRYVNYGESGYIMPAFTNNDSLKIKYIETMNYLFETYKYLVEQGVPVEDARFVLPYSFCSKIICTMNSRELIHFLWDAIYGRGKRYPEIKYIGEKLLKKLQGYAPNIFSNLENLERGVNEKESELNVLCNQYNIKNNFAEREEKVQLLYFTENPDERIASIALMNHTQLDKYTVESCIDDCKKEIIDIILRNKRQRELEHINFTFRINNITLSILTHISRHRMHCLLVPSFLEFGKSKNFVKPKTIYDNPGLVKIYEDAFEKSEHLYNLLRKEGINEEAVYSYLSGNLLDIITTMNGRELYHFLRLRCCLRAQWEVREIADLILRKIKEIAPLTFSKAGPSCFLYGFCPEGKNTCGKFEEVIDNYKNLNRELGIQ